MPGLGSAFAPTAFSLAKSAKRTGSAAIGVRDPDPNGKARPGQHRVAPGKLDGLTPDPSPPFGDPTPVEERLEAELSAPSLDTDAARAGNSGAAYPTAAETDFGFNLPKTGIQKELPLENPNLGPSNAVGKLTEEDAIVELATLRLERACRDVIDDARAEALMSHIVRNRDDVFADPLEEGGEAGSGNPSDPDELRQPARAFSRRISARRLAYAAGAIALLAGTPMLLGSDPTHWGERLAALRTAEPAVGTVEWRRPIGQDDHQAGAAFAAVSDSTWRVNLAERLANKAVPLGETKAASGVEASLQEWQARNSSLSAQKQADEALGDADGITLAVATALEDTPQAGSQAVGNAALAESIVRVGAKPLQQAATAQANSAASAITDASGASQRVVALASPRPEDVLAAATAREIKRKASRETAQNPQPRDPAKVDLALASAPGLAELRNSQRRELTARLVKGECLSSSLSDYFSPVPILLMRDLVRDLDSEC
jgi:hypothetical protein